MMFFVEIAKGNGVGENLVEIFGTFGANGFVQTNGKLGQFAVGLNFVGMLMKNRARTIGPGLRVGF
jgi:hypothetical protein